MKISLIIAAYNVEKFLEKCVRSCCNQSVDPSVYEIIVVNDGSTDGTLSILKQLKLEFKNLLIIDQANQGLGAARNAGLKMSSGDYVWFIDGDDYLAEQVLNGIIECINKNKADVLILNYDIVDQNYNTITGKANEIIISGDVESGSKFYSNNFLKNYTWTFIFNINLFRNYDINFQERINMQDSEILPKLLIHAPRVSFFNETCYYYVQHPNSFTNSNRGSVRYKYFESIVIVYNSLASFLKDEANGDMDMIDGLNKKLKAIKEMVFYHLIFYKYDEVTMSKIISLLKDNNLYPLNIETKLKYKLLKLGLNKFPYLTNYAVNKFRG